MSALLDVRALTKRFPVRGSERRVHAVDDVSFTIERGESVASSRPRSSRTRRSGG